LPVILIINQMYKLNIVLFSICFAFLVGCDKSKNCGNNATTGTIKDYAGLDGCGFVIELSTGKRLEPINLIDMKIAVKDGKKVRFTYKSVSSGSICMVGEMVELLCMEED